MRLIYSLLFLFLLSGFSFGQRTVSRANQEESNRLYERSLNLYEDGFTDEAIIPLDSSIQLNSFNLDALYLRAVIKELFSDPVGALIDYETIVRINPDYLEAYVGKALIYHQQNNYEEAIRNLNHILNYDGIHETKAIYFKTSGYTKGPSRGGISSVTSLASMREDMLYRRAIVYRDMGEYGKAKRDITNLISDNPNYPEYHTVKGMIFNKLNLPDSAIISFRQALALEPGNKSASYQLHLLDPSYSLPDEIFEDEEFHYAFAKKGFDAFEVGDYDEAIEFYSYAIKASPDESDYYSTRGLAYEKIAEFDLAIQDFEKALKLDSYFIANYYRIGNILFKRKSYSKANQYYTIYLSYAPDDERVLFNSAMAHLQLKQTEEGCRKLQTSANLGMTQAAQLLNKYCKN